LTTAISSRDVHRRDLLLRRERLLDEEVLDAAVLGAAQQDHLGVLDAAAGAADLLVVGDDRAGRLVVHDELQVRLVVAHPQRAGRDERLDVVAQQPLLGGDPPLGLLLAAVGQRRDVVRGQEGGDLLGVALGQRVDDPRAGQARQVLDQPGEPLRGARQLQRLQPQAGAAERAAVGAQARVGDAGRGRAGGGLARALPQLVEHVGDDAVVGGRGRAEHGDARGQRGEHVLDTAVVGPEVVAPVRDAVRLVDHQQPDRGGEQRQQLVAEARVVEPLGRDQQQVDLAGGEHRADRVPLVAVGAVDRVRSETQPLRAGDLVAHQRQQRRDDQRRAGALRAQQRGRDEVDGRLAPAGALHAQHARAVGDDVVDRLQLAVAEACGRVARQRAQAVEAVGGEVGGDGGHDRRG
jgi:hypothetical protein